MTKNEYLLSWTVTTHAEIHGFDLPLIECRTTGQLVFTPGPIRLFHRYLQSFRVGIPQDRDRESSSGIFQAVLTVPLPCAINSDIGVTFFIPLAFGPWLMGDTGQVIWNIEIGVGNSE